MAGPVFEWDARKAAGNRRKHGVSFDEAFAEKRQAPKSRERLTAARQSSAGGA